MIIPTAPRDLWRTIAREVTDPSQVPTGLKQYIVEGVLRATPGGVDFARYIERLFRDTKDRSSEWLQGEGSAQAAAALAIIYESGWQRHVSSADFYLSDEETQSKVLELADIEGKIAEGSIPPLAETNRGTPTIIP